MKCLLGILLIRKKEDRERINNESECKEYPAIHRYPALEEISKKFTERELVNLNYVISLIEKAYESLQDCSVNKQGMLDAYGLEHLLRDSKEIEKCFRSLKNHGRIVGI